MVDISNFVWRETDLPHSRRSNPARKLSSSQRTEYRMYVAIIFACFFPLAFVTWAWRSATGQSEVRAPWRVALSQSREIAAAIFLP